MLNWIVWNRTDYLYENGFGIKLPTKVDMLSNPNNQPMDLLILPEIEETDSKVSREKH